MASIIAMAIMVSATSLFVVMTVVSIVSNGYVTMSTSRIVMFS